MDLFIKCYNQYIKKHKLKHSDKNFINFEKSRRHKRGDKKKNEMLHATNVKSRGIQYNMSESQQTQ